MASNKTFNSQPIPIPAAAANLMSPALGSLAGPVGFAMSQPYLIIQHIRISNKTAAPVTVTLYKGATGGSAAGTEVGFVNASIPANGALDYYGKIRLDAADFLTGIAGAANALVMNPEGEVGLS